MTAVADLAAADVLGPWLNLPAVEVSTREAVRAASAGSLRPGLALERQLRSNWCWSAVTASVRRFYDPASPWLQCSLADALVAGAARCCVNGGSPACDQPLQLDRALDRVDCLGSSRGGHEAFAALRGEIDGNRPLCCFVDWGEADVGHFVVVTGWTVRGDGVEQVSVADPASGSMARMTYETLRSSYAGRGSWTWSYRTKPLPARGAPSIRTALPADSPVGG